MVEAIEVTQVRYKPYATIERTDFLNAIIFREFGIIWKLLNVNINMAHENYATYEF